MYYLSKLFIMRIILLIILASGLLFSKAQSQRYRVLDIPLSDSTTVFNAPWGGGMNNCVIQPIDFNNDGIEDLLVMDRNGNKIMTFLNNGSTTIFPYTYAPQYEKIFPLELSNWVLVRDFNTDGVPDIFTFNNAYGIVCYLGKRTGDNLSFSIHLQSLRYYSGFWDRILPNINDIPIIRDIDKDGDLDVIDPTFWSGLTMDYYKNQQVENHYSKDSMVFLLETTCWGGFQKNNTSATLMACKNGVSQRPFGANRHSNGGPLMDFDYDNDGDVDVLVSNVGNSNVVFLKNAGDSAYADMNYVDSSFPNYNIPVNIKLTPAMFNIDVDNNGRKDLLVTSYNYDLLDIGLMTDINNIYYYKNQLLPTTENFEFVRKNLFKGMMFDIGTNASIVPFDYNNDGKIDLVVSNHSSFDAEKDLFAQYSRLVLLENIGTIDSPAFKVVNNDWFSLSRYMLNSIYPTFGDMDGDGLPDMIIGESTGRLHFFKNNGTVGNPDFSGMTTQSIFGLNVGNNSAPFLFDVNKDTLLDLVVGRKDGKISYFKNTGRQNTFQFDMMTQNPNFGNIKTTNSFASIGNSCPFIITENGKDVLYSGSFFIQTMAYEINPDSVDQGGFAMIDSNITRERIGYNATIAVADLNNDGYKEYLVGTSRGGMVIYSDTIMDKQAPNAIAEQKTVSLSIFPNPANAVIHIVADENINAVMLVDMLGRICFERNEIGKNTTLIDGINLPNGVYSVVINTDSGRGYKKIVIQK